MYRNSSTSANKRRSANYRWWRAVHLITGFLVALWLLGMSATGVLINHQEGLGLTEMDVSNRHLPAHYTDDFHPETTRLSVVLADLHSGRFFGATGKLISDAVALMVFLSIGTGVYSFFLRRSASSVQQVENGYAAEERRKPDERLVAHIPVKPALEAIDKTPVLTASESISPRKRAVAQASAITSERPLSQPVDR